MAPPLSYSLPGFRPGDFASAPVALDRLAALGFKWVTFTPTYALRDGYVPTLHTLDGPALPELDAAIRYAFSLGLSVKLEPHVDWWSTLHGGPYEWRRRAYFAPAAPLPAYGTALLEPMARLLAEAAPPSLSAALTLGSELDVSLLGFPGGEDGWQALLGRVRSLTPSLRLGHKINHDTLPWNRDLIASLQAERTRRGLERADVPGLQSSAVAYLDSLDTLAVSFYPVLPLSRTALWWQDPTTTEHVTDLSTEFRRALSALRDVLPPHPALSIGEFGLGSSDPYRPWHFDAATFLDPSGRMTIASRETRRKFILGFLDALRTSNSLFGPDPATFWTVTHYDFLDALGQRYSAGSNPDAAREFQDDLLTWAVSTYNREREAT